MFKRSFIYIARKNTPISLKAPNPVLYNTWENKVEKKEIENNVSMTVNSFFAMSAP